MFFSHRYRGLGLAAVIAASLIMTACSGGTTNTTDVQTLGTAAPAANGATTKSNTPGPQTTPGIGGTTDANGVTVAPDVNAVGNVKMTLAIGAAQHMGEPQATVSQQPGKTGSDSDKNAPSGEIVFSGNLLRATNNFDPSQKPPADSANGDMLRQVAVQVKDKTSGQVVPYLVVGMDILRDGKPVMSDQALVPAVPVGAGIDQLRYVNNIKFPGKGTYQIFVRLAPNPLLGSDSLPAAQFNVTFP